MKERNDLNRSKAIYWWSKAASLGNQYAQCNLGRAYELGMGIVRNIQKAKHFYSLAADNKNQIAQFNLARLKIKSGLKEQAQAAFHALVLKLRKLSRSRSQYGSNEAKVCLAKCAYNGCLFCPNPPHIAMTHLGELDQLEFKIGLQPATGNVTLHPFTGSSVTLVRIQSAAISF